MVTVIDGQDGFGRWLSIQEAARHLSVSERTIYRRAERGQLRRRSLQDGRVEVWVPLTVGNAMSAAASDTDRHEHALLLVERFGDALTRQLGPLVDALGAAQRRAEDLARENGHLQARVAQLERELVAVRQTADDVGQPATSHQTRVAPHLAAQAPEPIPPKPDGAPWLRRWLTWVTAL